MLKFVMILFVTLPTVFVWAYVVEPGPKHLPTKGEVWPKPQNQTTSIKYYTLNSTQIDVKAKLIDNKRRYRKELRVYSSNVFVSFVPAESYLISFDPKITNHNCSLLMKAKTRYVNVFNVLPRMIRNHTGSKRNSHQNLIKELQINLTAPCEDYPYLEMDESYNLTVSTEAILKSASIWGILHGLETFAHLFYITDDYDEVRINSTRIVDYPLYQHRGLLLDTGRHFVTMRNILLTLDSMTMNKMNVFHWHIVDDQSFPYQSHMFPELSAKGAFHQNMVYTKANIDEIVEYARERGIRVIPEFDVPAHTRSWGEAFPHILTKCYNSQNQPIGLGPMDPTKNTTYKLLKDLFREVQEWFPDKYFHIGGDELDTACWQSNPQIVKYMKQHNIAYVKNLHDIFMQNTLPLLANISIPIVWQEVFDEQVKLPKDTLVQVWYGNQHEMVKVLKAGHRVLYSDSSEWYLDHLDVNFQTFYSADPRQAVVDATQNKTLAQNVIGGEACMWGETIDNKNLLPRMWPRASAVAERLWSPVHGKAVPEEAFHRIEEHAGRMLQRGIPSSSSTLKGFIFLQIALSHFIC